MKKSFFLATALACLLSACESKLVEQVQLIPQAENVEIQNGAYALKNLQSIHTPEAWKATAENFINDVKKTASLQVSLASEGASVVLVENTQEKRFVEFVKKIEEPSPPLGEKSPPFTSIVTFP